MLLDHRVAGTSLILHTNRKREAKIFNENPTLVFLRNYCKLSKYSKRTGARKLQNI